MSENIYNIDYLTEREVRKLEEDENKGGGRKYIFLSPSKKEDERVTSLRLILLKSNKFGQVLPWYIVQMHKRLNDLVPGTRRKLFPNIEPGVEELPCLNHEDNDTYCPICDRVKTWLTDHKKIIEQAAREGDSKAVAAEKSLRGYFGNVKRTRWHYFVAIKKTGFVEKGKEWEAGMVPAKKEGNGLVRCKKEEAQIWLDQVGVLTIKDWWIKPFFDAINEREMTYPKYCEKMGKKVDRKDWMLNCPKKRPEGPFHPEKGWNLVVTVTRGNGGIPVYSVNNDEVEALTKPDKYAIACHYPNLMEEIQSPGEPELMSFEDYVEAGHGKTKAQYHHWKMGEMGKEYISLLGLDKKETTSKEDVIAAEDDDGPENYSMDDEDLDLPF